MRDRTKTTLATFAIAAVAVVGMDTYTYAGTGDSLILGKVNKSKKTTHVISTGNGPALSLQAKGNRPALKVDSKAKVVKLNADLVDGKDASSLQNNVRVYTATKGTSFNGFMRFELPNFPAGTYQASYSVFTGVYGTTPADPVSAYCYFYKSPQQILYSGWSAATSVREYQYAALSATDVIKKDRDAWYLQCIVSSDWHIWEDRPVRVMLTKIDKTVGGKLTSLLKAS